MNQWLQKVQTMVQQQDGQGNGANLAGLLAPGALGGLMGLLIANKSSRKLVGEVGKNALFIGGGAAVGAVLWDQYKKRTRDARSQVAEPALQAATAPTAAPFTQAAAAPTPIDRRTRRLVTALVFAAKSDGHINDQEQRSIQQHLQQLGLGEEAEHLVQEAINQPLDPDYLARDVGDENEALELYYVSCVVADVDHFMERSYMDALARALKIPDEVKAGLETQVNDAIAAANP